jgi:hypothetical protein
MRKRPLPPPDLVQAAAGDPLAGLARLAREGDARSSNALLVALTPSFTSGERDGRAQEAQLSAAAAEFFRVA